MLERTRVVVATLVVLAGGAGCTNDDGAADTTVTTPAPGTTAPTEPTVSRPTTPDGTGPAPSLGLDTALSQFAAAYAPLPRVEPAPRVPVDGGPALRLVLAEIDQLGDRQRTVVARAVAPPGRPLSDVLSAQRPNRRLRAAARTARDAIDTFGGERGRPLSDEVKVTVLALPYENGDGSHNLPSPTIIATAIPFGDGAARTSSAGSASTPTRRWGGEAWPTLRS